MRKTTIIIVFAACMIATIAKGLGAQPHATSAEQDRHSSFSSTTHYPGSKMVEIAMARLRDAETAASLDNLEHAVDECEDVANVLESISLKNS